MGIIVEGNILNIKEGIIIQQVNCKGKMNSGIAKSIATKYPIVKERYLKVCSLNTADNLLGKMHLVKVDTNLFFLNSFSQFSYGRDKNVKYTDEQLLINNINRAMSLSVQYKLPLFAPCYIGCGLGNGVWENILSGTKNTQVTYLKI
ncbi:macro domain-containing protein [Enterococcus sp. 4E1_DIV0656]|uniref:macro domain-containing protein n=1 Tax=unclassified Enterococcus TaxID=2608891 RepID=UPI000A375C16|nr:macro domain-containing protein [Enterococcus sp. 4E1_DIV0656]OTO09175.1 hypothetical protein A5882_003505 [Enterococcus sp. 4E1_DIV0656]